MRGSPMTDPFFADDAPYHAHIYFMPEERNTADRLWAEFAQLKSAGGEPNILFVGRMTIGKARPHPIPQFEVHFLKRSLAALLPMIEASRLRAQLHPLTHIDLANQPAL